MFKTNAEAGYLDSLRKSQSSYKSGVISANTMTRINDLEFTKVVSFSTTGMYVINDKKMDGKIVFKYDDNEIKKVIIYNSIDEVIHEISVGRTEINREPGEDDLLICFGIDKRDEKGVVVQTQYNSNLYFSVADEEKTYTFMLKGNKDEKSDSNN